MSDRATGKDDPELEGMVWPMPCEGLSQAIDRALWSEPTRQDRLLLAEVAQAYRALVVDGKLSGQQHTLAALRRVHKRRARALIERGEIDGGGAG